MSLGVKGMGHRVRSQRSEIRWSKVLNTRPPRLARPPRLKPRDDGPARMAGVVAGRSNRRTRNRRMMK
ncbi:MAG: hypothetical protein LJE89_01365 [Deltaproteobacteria bacterium]|nr:hypothetical protein [Deltaproteobacteria bacterium]